MLVNEEIKQNYRDLHEQTGESYESIAKRAASQGDPGLAAWLRREAAGQKDEEQARTEPPRGRSAIRAETAAAEEPKTETDAAAEEPKTETDAAAEEPKTETDAAAEEPKTETDAAAEAPKTGADAKPSETARAKGKGNAEEIK